MLAFCEGTYLCGVKGRYSVCATSQCNLTPNIPGCNLGEGRWRQGQDWRVCVKLWLPAHTQRAFIRVFSQTDVKRVQEGICAEDTNKIEQVLVDLPSVKETLERLRSSTNLSGCEWEVSCVNPLTIL